MSGRVSDWLLGGVLGDGLRFGSGGRAGAPGLSRIGAVWKLSMPIKNPCILDLIEGMLLEMLSNSFLSLTIMEIQLL